MSDNKISHKIFMHGAMTKVHAFLTGKNVVFAMPKRSIRDSNKIFNLTWRLEKLAIGLTFLKNTIFG